MTAAIELSGIRVVHNAHRPDEVHALRGVDLTVEDGEFVTVVGSNGAGKSTLVQVVAGAIRPTTGRVHLAGRDVTGWPDHRRAATVSRVFDDPRTGTAPDLSIEDNMAVAMSRGQRRGLRVAVTARRRQLMRDRLATLGLGLEERLHDPVGSLSAGQRQSLTLILAALGAPSVLLLDEHLAALDPVTARLVLDLTSAIVADVCCATLMVTHNMEHAIDRGDRMVVMSRGRIVADVAGDDKRSLTVDAVVRLIIQSGDTASDRLLLPDLATV
jgi:putative ABC transport system ATP-binding protein